MAPRKTRQHADTDNVSDVPAQGLSGSPVMLGAPDVSDAPCTSGAPCASEALGICDERSISGGLGLSGAPHIPEAGDDTSTTILRSGEGLWFENDETKRAIYERLRDWILYTRLQPGQKLNERELAERFGVSRTPMREVLQCLGTQGLLVVRPRQGVFVAPLEPDIVRETFEARLPLERAVARLAAYRATPAERAGLLELAGRVTLAAEGVLSVCKRATPEVGGVQLVTECVADVPGATSSAVDGMPTVAEEASSLGEGRSIATGYTTSAVGWGDIQKEDGASDARSCVGAVRTSERTGNAEGASFASDVERMVRLDAAFHDLLAVAAHNPTLRRTRESLHNICLRYWFLLASGEPGESGKSAGNAGYEYVDANGCGGFLGRDQAQDPAPHQNTYQTADHVEDKTEASAEKCVKDQGQGRDVGQSAGSLKGQTEAPLNSRQGQVSVPASHLAIAEAVARGDADAAEALLAKHVQHFVTLLPAADRNPISSPLFR